MRSLIAPAVALALLPSQVLAASTDKTLVSWVAISDRNVRAGSVLTVQDGDRFDGIVFAEVSGNKWMAGSDRFRRTEKTQSEYPSETSGPDELIQMAVVYRNDSVTIYRNGALYRTYKARNVDLLGSTSNIVVFGLRHIGGGGSIAGAIEDARIYPRSLSIDEIKSLRPNQPSPIEPYAWWDFEGDKVVDRAGRFGHVKLVGATLKGGRLMLKKGAVAGAARTKAAAAAVANAGGSSGFTGPYVPETPAWPDDPPDNWAIYHLAHPTFSHGSPFDPNPALFYKGRYHLHYIYRNRTGFVFAHVSSMDMVRWKWHPTVLAPPATGHGMFSGTGFFTKEGRPAMVYHGQGSNRNWILYGLDGDLDEWGDQQVMLPKDKDGSLMTKVRYFDPDIWIMDGKYYGLNGRSSRESPTIMKSDDLRNWTYIGEFLHPDFDDARLGTKKGEDISCPNVFALGGKWVLVCISHRMGCRYFVGDFVDDQFLPEQHALMGGSSKRYFAPETLLTPDGRRVLWTWFLGGQTKGVQSLPTEIELPRDGVMRFRPIRELESLRYDPKMRSGLRVPAGRQVVLDGIEGDHLELEIVARAGAGHGFAVDVLCDAQGSNGLRIGVDSDSGMLLVGGERAPFDLGEGESLTLRIFVDGTLVEVYANRRQYVMTDKPRAAGAKIDGCVALSSVAGITVDRINAWKMKSAYGGNR